MSIPNRQIGWSNEANLMWYISKELDMMLCNAACCSTTTTTKPPTTTTTTTLPPTTTTTTTTVNCNCRELVGGGVPYDYYDCLGTNWVCPNPEAQCITPTNFCIDISQPYSGVTPSEDVTENCNCNTTTSTTTIIIG